MMWQNTPCRVSATFGPENVGLRPKIDCDNNNSANLNGRMSIYYVGTYIRTRQTALQFLDSNFGALRR